MSKKIIGLIVVCMSILCFILILKKENYDTSYWIWAGITSDDAPANAELYVYQGLITAAGNHTDYQRIGLYPYPIKSEKFYLVYRLTGSLPDPAAVVAIFQNNASRWQRHAVKVSGLQLDFDSATGKLLLYSNFLKQIRAHLPKEYALSITGLGDWIIYGDKQVMQSIAMTTQEIVFQLYQGRHPLLDIKRYILALRRYPFPFRVGLLPQYINKYYIYSLRQNVRFKGVIYFIQKNI